MIHRYTAETTATIIDGTAAANRQKKTPMLHTLMLVGLSESRKSAKELNI